MATTTTYSASHSWTQLYQGEAPMAYPAEAVIRIFLGQFPKLDFDQTYHGRSILDLGYGDGRHFPLFHRLSLAISGIEISDAINTITRNKPELSGIPLDLQTGHAGKIPYSNDRFDYVLAWNSCYYMSSGAGDFNTHVEEMLRVTKPNGQLVVSVPCADNFVFEGCRDLGNGYAEISDEHFGMRNGEVMRRFASMDELKAAFAPGCDVISDATIRMDWFGLNYHWLVITAKKRPNI